MQICALLLKLAILKQLHCQ